MDSDGDNDDDGEGEAIDRFTYGTRQGAGQGEGGVTGHLLMLCGRSSTLVVV